MMCDIRCTCVAIDRNHCLQPQRSPSPRPAHKWPLSAVAALHAERLARTTPSAYDDAYRFGFLAATAHPSLRARYR